MGVADKQTYKNQYHFTDDSKDTSKEHPSIEQDPKINAIIKSNPFRSNVEIEGDEIVLQPDLSALFRAKGKKHSGGGMDVLLKPDSFIFSDYDGLKITKDEHELFELKEGGTPADTLRKNINPKHYNTMVNILDNPFKDDLSKKSASKMLEKYIATLGNIAYIQENKKGFPTGVPEFAMGTAPVYDKDLKATIDSNKQYMKAGGSVKNPYKMQNAGLVKPEDVLSNLLNVGKEVSNIAQRKDRYTGTRPPYPNTWTNYFDKASNTQYTAPDWISPTEFYATPGLVEYMKTLDKQKGIDWDMNKADDGWWGWRHEAARQKFYPDGSPKIVAKPSEQQTPFKCPDGYYFNGPTGQCMPLVQPKATTAPAVNAAGPKVEDIKGPAQGAKIAAWQFTPWQKASQLYSWGQYANVKRYMPFRSRYNATYVDPALLNPEQTIGDAKAVANQQIESLKTLSPTLRNAQAASAFGQLLNQIPNIRSQYDNQNAQIVNQNRVYNNQVKNNESMVNMGLDQQYYRESVEGRKNFENMRQYLSNQAMNNTMRDVENNQKLAYSLLTQNNPAYGFDWKSGNFTRNQKSILDAQGDNKGDFLTDFVSKQVKDWDKMTIDQRNQLLKILVAKGFTPSTGAGDIFGSQKKGGSLKKKNPYRY